VNGNVQKAVKGSVNQRVVKPVLRPSSRHSRRDEYRASPTQTIHDANIMNEPFPLWDVSIVRANHPGEMTVILQRFTRIRHAEVVRVLASGR
jgi:hypothetical protein